MSAGVSSSGEVLAQGYFLRFLLLAFVVSEHKQKSKA